MSLAIRTATVEAVLLIDGWHFVAGESFDCDTYEFYDSPDVMAHASGKGGFQFIERLRHPDGMESAETIVAGPISAIQAVRYVRP